MSSSSTKRLEILAKLEVIQNNSDNEAYEVFEPFLKDHLGADSFSLNACKIFWKNAFLRLGKVREKLSLNKPVAPSHLSELYDLLDLIKVENSSYKFPTNFESVDAAEEYFDNLRIASRNCLREYFPGKAEEFNSVFLVYSEANRDGKDLNGFNFFLGQNQFKFNLYKNLVLLFPSENPKKYAVKMFGLTIFVDKELYIEASPDLNNFELIFLDNIRIPISLKPKNLIEIVPIGKL